MRQSKLSGLPSVGPRGYLPFWCGEAVSCSEVEFTSVLCVSVRPSARRRFLEQRQIQHGQLPAPDDDQLGHRRQRVVPPPHDHTGTPHLKHFHYTFSV